MSSPTTPDDTVQVTLTWPSINVRDVIVTGDFDNWAMLTHMTKPALPSPRSRTTSRAASPHRSPPLTPTATNPAPNNPVFAPANGYFPPSFLGIGANGNDAHGRGAGAWEEARFPFHTVALPAGSALAARGFEYKFFVDGVWQTSPRAPTRVDPSGKYVNNMWTPPKPKVITPAALEEAVEDAKTEEAKGSKVAEAAGKEKVKKLDGEVEEKVLSSAQFRSGAC